MAEATAKVKITAEEQGAIKVFNSLKKEAESAKKRLDDMNKSGQSAKTGLGSLGDKLKGVGGSLGGFGGSLGGVLGSLGKVAPALAVVGAALAGLKKTISSTQATSDLFAENMEKGKAVVDSFFRSLANGDFSGFLDGLGDTINRAQELYRALDALGDFTEANRVLTSGENLQLKKLEDQIRDERTTKEDRGKAIEEFRKIIETQKERGNLINNKTIEAALGKVSIAAGEPITLAHLDDYYGKTLLGTNVDVNEYKKKENEFVSDYIKKQTGKAIQRTAPLTPGDTGLALLSNDPVDHLEDEARKQYRKAHPEQYKAYIINNNLTDDERKGIGDLIVSSNQLRGVAYDNQKKLLRLQNIGKEKKGKGQTVTGVEVEVPEGSIRAIETKIKELKDKFNTATSDTVRRQIQEDVEALEEEKENIIKNSKVKNLPPPTISPPPPLALDLRPDIDKAKAKITQLREEIEAKKIDLKLHVKGSKEYNSISKEIEDKEHEAQSINDANFGKKEINVDVKGVEDVKSLTGNVDEAGKALEGFAGILSGLSGVVDEGAAGWLRWGANLLSTIARAIPQITALTAAQTASATIATADAGAKAASAVAGIPLAGPFMAIAAIASIFGALASAPKFEGGGVVGGSSYYGDKLFARVNSGELILNKKQQESLHNELTGKVYGAGALSVNIKGDYRLRGDQLVLLYDKTVNNLNRN